MARKQKVTFRRAEVPDRWQPSTTVRYHTQGSPVWFFFKQKKKIPRDEIALPAYA
jgi:hypothetical protein